MQDKDVNVFNNIFDLSDDRFKDVKTLKDLENLDVFPELHGEFKREAESQLFNCLYAYQHKVDGDEPKVMTPENTVSGKSEKPARKKTPKENQSE